MERNCRDHEVGPRPAAYHALHVPEERQLDRIDVEGRDGHDHAFRQVCAASLEQLALSESAEAQFVVASRVGLEKGCAENDIVGVSLRVLARPELTVQGRVVRHPTSDRRWCITYPVPLARVMVSPSGAMRRRMREN